MILADRDDVLRKVKENERAQTADGQLKIGKILGNKFNGSHLDVTEAGD